jgi:hypothetical protein
MRKMILTALLAVLASAGVLEAQTQMVVRVTAERTGLREQPDTSATVVTTVSKGEELTVLETSGNWYRVRTKSAAQGFVHSLFVERVSGAAGAAPAASSSTAPAASVPASTGPAPAPRAATAAPPTPPPAVSSADERHIGAGITTGGLAFGFTPSLRYWMNPKTGFEVNFSFLDSAGYSVTAISPSVLIRIGEEKRAGSVAFQPYAGGGITYWRFSNDYSNYYCNVVGVDCDTSAIGVGGFGGTEILFDAVPKLAASASLGFYSSPSSLGYGGLYLSVAGHYYFK